MTRVLSSCLRPARPWAAWFACLVLLGSGCGSGSGSQAAGAPVSPVGEEALPAGPGRWAEVVHVLDGDTLVVRLDGRNERVRLLGVDAPEKHHPERPAEFMADEAREFVRRLCEGRRVRLVEDPQADDRDKYGRLLRYVVLEDGRLLNAELVRHGLAFAFTRFPFSLSATFRALEDDARRRGVGLWSGGALDELRWNLRHGIRPFVLHEMTDRDWAVQVGPYVKTHVPEHRLEEVLREVRRWVHELDGDELERRLLSEGWKRAGFRIEIREDPDAGSGRDSGGP